MTSEEKTGMAERYERYWRRDGPPPLTDPTTPARWRALRRALAHLPAGAKVLDFGCGSGLFSGKLIGEGYEVTGVDISETALALARERFPEGGFANVADESWRIADSFDACWCSEVLEHLLDPGADLRRIARALKPGGIFVGTVPYHGLVKNLAVCLLGFERHFDVEGEHIRFFTRRSLGRLLLTSGLEPVRWVGVGRMRPFWKALFVVARKATS